MPGLTRDNENKNAFSNITAGSPASIDLPGNRGLIHRIRHIYEEGAVVAKADEPTMIAACEALLLQIDGSDYSEFKPADLIMLNKFYGFPFEAGYLDLYFHQPWRANVAEQESTSFVPSAHRNPRTSFLIADGRVNPGLRQKLLTTGLGDTGRKFVAQQPAQSVNMTIKHWLDQINLISTGATPTRYRYEGGGERIRGLHFQGSQITAIRMLVNEQEYAYWKDVRELNVDLENNGFSPQANVWHVAFEALGNSVNAAYNPNFNGQKDVIDFEIFASDDTNNVNVIAEQYNRPQAKS